MYDLVLTNGLVVDGSRGKPYIANVCIRDGKIARITPDRVEALEAVDVAGLAVTPGFIDTHTHSDASHMQPYPVESQVAQGVTTELAGNCGTSVMPATAARKEALDAHMRTRKGSECFLSVSDYAAAGNAHGACLNYGTLIGHSTLRLGVMGFVNRDPDAREMEALKALLEQEMQRGAFGMSLGLIYPPSAFCKTWELVELAKVVAKYDGILAVHMRNEGPRLFEAVEEMIGIARQSGVHVHISHLKIMGKPRWGQNPRLLKLLNSARAQGLNITCDQYPFPASSTSLSALVPHWAHEGGAEAMVARLTAREGDICQGIAREMENRGGPGAILVSNTYGRNTQWQGKYISQLMEELGLDPVETVRHVLINCGGRAFCVYFSMSREDMLAIMRQMFICVGSDGESLSHDKENTPFVPHPRYFSAFSRFYQTVREERLMPLEDAVYKTTALPASILGLQSKGLLREGMDADIAVFDPERFASRSDFLESRARPVGMHHVLVAGQFVIRDGSSTGAKPGRVILKRS